MVELDLGFKIPDTLPLAIAEFIILLKRIEVGIGLKIIDTIIIEILDQ